MNRSARHFRVGLMVLCASTLFLGLIVFVLGSSLSSQALIYYILFEENVKGMVIGSRVNFQGVPAGSVKDIRFQDGKSLVEVSVGADKCIVQPVTRARLDRLLVTGQVTIELEGYTPGAPRLESGSQIMPKENPIGQLARRVPDFLDEVPEMFGKLERALDAINTVLGPQNQRSIQDILTHLDEVIVGMPQRMDAVVGLLSDPEKGLPPVLEEARLAVREIQRAAAGLSQFAHGSDLHGAVAEARRAAEKLAEVQAAAVALADEARGLLAGSRGKLTDALSGFRDALRELQSLARTLRLAPSSLFYGRTISEPGGGGQ